MRIPRQHYLSRNLQGSGAAERVQSHAVLGARGAISRGIQSHNSYISGTKSEGSFFLQVGYRISPVIAELHSGFFECQASYMGRSDSYTIDVTVRPKTSFVPPPHINR